MTPCNNSPTLKKNTTIIHHFIQNKDIWTTFSSEIICFVWNEIISQIALIDHRISVNETVFSVNYIRKYKLLNSVLDASWSTFLQPIVISLHFTQRKTSLFQILLKYFVIVKLINTIPGWDWNETPCIFVWINGIRPCFRYKIYLLYLPPFKVFLRTFHSTCMVLKFSYNFFVKKEIKILFVQFSCNIF